MTRFLVQNEKKKKLFRSNHWRQKAKRTATTNYFTLADRRTKSKSVGFSVSASSRRATPLDANLKEALNRSPRVRTLIGGRALVSTSLLFIFSGKVSTRLGSLEVGDQTQAPTA